MIIPFNNWCVVLMHRLVAFFLSFIYPSKYCAKKYEIPSFFSVFWNSTFCDLDLDFHLQINSNILLLCLAAYMLFLLNCLKICQIPIFSTFWKLSKSAYFKGHVLLMCVTYLMFLILSYRAKLVQYTSMLVSEIWWTHFEGMIGQVCLFFTFFFAFSTKLSLT